MLKQRVITAIIMLAVLVSTLLAPSAWPLVALLSLIAACTLWEWLRLTLPNCISKAAGIIAAALGVGLLWLGSAWLAATPVAWGGLLQAHLNLWLLPLVTLVWIVVGTAMVVRGRAQQRSGQIWLSVFGVLAIVAVWGACVQMYLLRGAWFLVSLLALIWFADIAAYFTGKALGRRKLAPRVSPGKTWEGAAGGVAAATAWVMLCMLWPGSFGAVLAERWPVWLVVLIAIFLAALSIVGDLFESLLKRRAGVKDSSQLLPGHGGVYDRIDALLPVAPLALLLTGTTL